MPAIPSCLLKTSDFRILTRSQTLPQAPGSAIRLAAIARDLRGRVDLPTATRYRLVGVGLANFRDAGEEVQEDLFGAAAGSAPGGRKPPPPVDEGT